MLSNIYILDSTFVNIHIYKHDLQVSDNKGGEKDFTISMFRMILLRQKLQPKAYKVVIEGELCDQLGSSVPWIC